MVRELGQPSLIITPDRAKLARYGLNVSDINTLVGTAIGGDAATQVIQGERQFDLVVRMQEKFRGDFRNGAGEPADSQDYAFDAAERPDSGRPLRHHRAV